MQLAQTCGPSYSDGQVLFFDPNGRQQEIRLSLVLQCLLLASGSLDPAIVKHLVGQPERARRYLTLEVARAMHDAALLPRLILAGRIPVSPVRTCSAHESLLRSLDGTVAIIDLPVYGRIRPLAVLRRQYLALPAQRLARSPNRAERSDDEHPDSLDDEKAHVLPKGFRNFMSSVLDIRVPWARFLHEFFGLRGAPPTEAHEGDGVAQSASWRMQSRPAFDRGADGGGLSVDVASPPQEHALATSLRYPEWDFQRHAYRANWCSVHDVSFRDMRDLCEPRKPHRDPWMERSLRRMVHGLVRRKRQVDGDELDLPALIAHVVDLEAARRRGRDVGSQALVYSGCLRQAPEFSAMVLLDISGSTMARVGRTPGAERITDLQITLAETLVHGMTRITDRVAAFAFHSSGRTVIRVVRFKHFASPWSHQASLVMRSLRPSGYTRLGAALRHASREHLLQGGHERRLAVMISDGYPYDEDYSGRYAWEDLRIALGEAAAADIGIVWLCIGPVDGQLDAALSAHGHEAVSIAPEAFRHGPTREALVAAMQRQLRRDGACRRRPHASAAR